MLHVSVVVGMSNEFIIIIQLFLSLHFYLLHLHLLLNSCNGNDVKQHVFLGRPLVALTRDSCVVCWL